MDFLKKLGKFSIDYTHGTAEIDGKTVARVFIDFSQPRKHACDVLVARILANPHDQTIPLRLLNPTAELKTHFKDMTLGQAEPFDEVASAPRAPVLSPAEIQKFLDMFPWPSNLPDEQLQALQELIIEHHTVFAKHDTDLGKPNILPHRIELTGPPPRPVKPYRIPEAQQTALKKQLDSLLEANVIQRSMSPFSAPICLVKKKMGPCDCALTTEHSIKSQKRSLTHSLTWWTR